MKHLRKIATLIIAVIMVAAIAVGIGVIYAVRNVNVTFLSYADDNAETKILTVKESVLSNCRGRLISSISEEDVSSVLADDCFLESFEKVLPCTINITVQQRREVFTVFDGETYSTYDDIGKFMRTAEKNENSYDGAPNLIITGTDGDNDIKTVAAVCAIFKSEENFGSLRAAVKQVELYKSQTTITTDSDRLTFRLWSGLSIEIRDFTQHTAEKIKKAFKLFDRLEPEQTLRGCIYCLADVNAEATYNPNA